MENQNPKRKNVLFWADILLTAAALACTAYTLDDIWDDRSFGGFGSLFMLLMVTCAAAGGLLLISLPSKKGDGTSGNGR